MTEKLSVSKETPKIHLPHKELVGVEPSKKQQDLTSDGIGIVENWDLRNEINEQIRGKSMDLAILRAPQHPYASRYASVGFPACLDNGWVPLASRRPL